MNPSPVDHPFAAYRLNGVLELRADWDVASFGREVSDALGREVDAVRIHPAPHGERKIHVLVGASGYGKTHLFGRLLNAQKDRVQFIYVPMTSDPSRVSPADHIRWSVVETLFHPVGGNIPLRRLLARLLAPSYLAYLDQLDVAWKAKSRTIRQTIEAEPTSVLQLLAPVKELAPFHALTNSMQAHFANLSAGVVRALVLGLSEAANDARTWLRGERDCLSDERRQELLLTEDSPDATAVLNGVATLLQRIKTPLLLCLDQAEWLGQKDNNAFRDLTTSLISWLQAVPNLVLVLGCISDAWGELRTQLNKSFHDRAKKWELSQLSGEQAAEMIVRRMGSWPNLPDRAVEGWPFDLTSVKKRVASAPISPRSLLQECEREFDKWLAQGQKGSIELRPIGPPPPPHEAFVREWCNRLEAAKQSMKSAINYAEADLWEAMDDALAIAKLGGIAPEGIRIEKITPQALKESNTDPRPSANIDLVAGERRFAVVLAVSKKDGGQAFGHWASALEEALGDPVVGAVAVWPKAQLTVGKSTRGYLKYQNWLNAGKVRHFALDENEETFLQVEALRQLLKDAETGDLNLNGEAVPLDKCRRLLIETKVLARLKLFEMLFCNWPAIEAVRSASAVKAGAITAWPSATPAAPARKEAATPSPALAVLSTPQDHSPPAGESWAREKLTLVVQKLRGRGQTVVPDGFDLGPTFVRLKVRPKDDADFAKIKKQADNLKLHLALEHRPIIANQAGYISIDIQRPDRQFVPLTPLLGARPAKLDGQPAFPAGVDVMGKAHWLNLADPDTCHLLVAGVTGSGKSEFLKAILAGLAHQLGPDELTFILIDPKQVTFHLPGQSPYLPRAVVHDSEDALPLLEECCDEMERRYDLLRQRGKENVSELTGADRLLRWVIVFDEFADVMANRGHKRTMEAILSRLGAKARASGIHLVLATQRPEASVVTPLLRSNLPGRLSLHVISEKDSKIILPEQGDAAHLLGKGDLLWWHGGGLIRLQSPFLNKQELETFLRAH